MRHYVESEADYLDAVVVEERVERVAVERVASTVVLLHGKGCLQSHLYVEWLSEIHIPWCRR